MVKTVFCPELSSGLPPGSDREKPDHPDDRKGAWGQAGSGCPEDAPGTLPFLWEELRSGRAAERRRFLQVRKGVQEAGPDTGNESIIEIG